MNIAIDIDDTLTDSFEYFIPFVAEYFLHNSEAVSRAGIEAVLFTSKQNIGKRVPFRRVDSWKDVYRLSKEYKRTDK